MIDARNKHLTAWIETLPPRRELVARMALRYQAKNLGPEWAPRIDTLLDLLKIHSIAKMTKLLKEVHAADVVIRAWANERPSSASQDLSTAPHSLKEKRARGG